jgi:hypothetical protein
MFNLSDPKIGYLIISAQNENTSALDIKFQSNKLANILYAKDYTLIPVTGYYNQKYENSYIAITSDDNDNDKLRSDAIYLMDEFNQSSVIVKYINETGAKKILSDGSEVPLGIVIYNSDMKNKTYIYNGVSFSFIEQKRYYFPKDKKDLKSGMIVEYFNNNKWTERQIVNVDDEYDKMYRLLIKYKKLRICQS